MSATPSRTGTRTQSRPNCGAAAWTRSRIPTRAFTSGIRTATACRLAAPGSCTCPDPSPERGMPPMKRVLAAPLLALALLPMGSTADDQDVIDYRRHIMNTLEAQVAALGMIMSGRSEEHTSEL